ncbi:MAG: DUF167 family protein [Verrucomicrobiota bacterium]
MCAKLAIVVTPRASRSEFVGWQEDTLKVRIAAPPVDGQANAEAGQVACQGFGCA